MWKKSINGHFCTWKYKGVVALDNHFMPLKTSNTNLAEILSSGLLDCNAM
jgi:hypothetical protein